MASDMVVALGQAAVNGTALFGADCYARPTFRHRLNLTPGRAHPLDEVVRTTYLRRPPARQTCSVLGCRLDDCWGFCHAVNEHHVASGVTGWHSRVPLAETGLTDTELTRLALERGHTALHAVDVLTDLISRHGQCAEPGGRPGNPADNIFLIADPHEAFVVEAAGRHWAIQECLQVRAVTGAGLVRQDWDRLAPGFADLAQRHGWWHDDGHKLDVTCCHDPNDPSHAAARRRWGRATLALEQQNGSIDDQFLRRLLLDHYETSAASKAHRPPSALSGSFLAPLPGAPHPVLAWAAFGLPRVAVFFPVWLDGELPAALCQGGNDVWQQTQQLLALSEGTDEERQQLADALERLQTTFDRDVETFLPQAWLLKQQGDHGRLGTLATALMQKHVQLFEKEWRQLQASREPTAEPEYAEEYVSYIS
jgi:hypothetical protein